MSAMKLGASLFATLLFIAVSVVGVEVFLSMIRQDARTILGGITCTMGHQSLEVGAPLCHPDPPPPGEDSFEQHKWIAQPARLRCRGHIIEQLDPENNFRRGYALGHCLGPSCFHDRTHLLPWMLGTMENLNCAKRRVFLDLGSGSYNQSVEWFMTMYPVDFTEVHVFERVKGLFQVPEDGSEDVELSNTSVQRRTTKPGVPLWQKARIAVHEVRASNTDQEGGTQTLKGELEGPEAAVDISRYIKEDLKLKPDDQLIVKMNLEGEEWNIIPKWRTDPHIIDTLDEIFVEVHYHHPSMGFKGWTEDRFEHTREEAADLLQSLRDVGIFSHYWP